MTSSQSIEPVYNYSTPVEAPLAAPLAAPLEAEEADIDTASAADSVVEPIVEAESSLRPTISAESVPDPIPPVPPSPANAPSIGDQSSSGAFDWLQRALQLN